MAPEIAAIVKEMTLDERLQLVDEILENHVGEDVPLTPALIAELQRRELAIERGEMPMRDWEDFWAELNAKHAA